VPSQHGRAVREGYGTTINVILMVPPPFKRRRGAPKTSTSGLITTVITLLVGAGCAFLLAIVFLASRLGEVGEGESTTTKAVMDVPGDIARKVLGDGDGDENDEGGGGGRPRPPSRLSFPHLPPHLMAEEMYGDVVISDLLDGKDPTIAGLVATMQRFLSKLRSFLIASRDAPTPEFVIKGYFDLVDEYLRPLESTYRDTRIFPIREDDSIFMSLGAYRDHLLGETLRQAYGNAHDPDLLFVGAVVQNCFGIETTCRTGVEVKGTDENGNPITRVSDRPPDVNGIEEFCTDPNFARHCDDGRIRVLYVNETESNGPTTARYLASRLWGGETHYMQSDSHLRFAPDWDRHYKEDLRLAKSYPKAILSTYPSGFKDGDPPYMGGTMAPRLCTCEFPGDEGRHSMIRINTGHDCKSEQDAPTQIAYIAAGFFFARSEFLLDVPFDPYMPWIFMGEEIALSLRAWTHGWDAYAPRKDWIAHQYRPGKMGLPKFWENTARVFGGRGGFDNEVRCTPS
jgi:[Skp1-protein]-hydroxyproline N-acetylglucosaminyltransferase